MYVAFKSREFLIFLRCIRVILSSRKTQGATLNWLRVEINRPGPQHPKDKYIRFRKNVDSNDFIPVLNGLSINTPPALVSFRLA